MPAPYVIAVDPGHGGSLSNDPNVLWDPGVVVGSVMEKDITLDLAFRLRALLQRERVRVVLTRDRDQFVEISDRWNRVHASGARLFVSLHINAFDGDPSINGLTIFYPKPQSLALAQAVDGALARALAPFGSADDGVALKADLWVRSDIPTVTVEPAFLTNSREAALLQRGDFRDAIAQGVYGGLLAADPHIEATRQKIVQVEALQEAQRRSEREAAAAIRGLLFVLAVLALGGMTVFVAARVALRSLVRPRSLRRRAHRARRRFPRRV